MWACRPTPHSGRRTALHTAVGGPMWASAPTGESSSPGASRNPVPGGHTGRPYGKTGGGSVGADFISARAAPPCRMHPRDARPYEETGGGAVGAACMAARAALPRCMHPAERTHRRGAHRASVTRYGFCRTGSRCTRSRRHVGMPPYASQRSANCFAHGGWRADVGIGPYERSAKKPSWLRSRTAEFLRFTFSSDTAYVPAAGRSGAGRPGGSRRRPRRGRWGWR